MARPKLPLAQHKGLQMTGRLRPDLNYALALVSVLHGTTKSGLVSQHAGEGIRLEPERNRFRFEAAVKDIRFQREMERRKKSVLSPFGHASDTAEFLKAAAEERLLTRLWCLESRPHARLIEPIYDGGRRVIRPRAEAYLLSDEERALPVITPAARIRAI